MSDTDHPRCVSCIHWKRLQARAVIGRCLMRGSGSVYTNEAQSLLCHEARKPAPA
jgi:hypothetical protein